MCLAPNTCRGILWRMNTAAPSPDAPPFQTVSALIRGHAQAQPTRPALLQGETRIDYATLDALMDRVAASLQRDGLKAGDAIAVCAHATAPANIRTQVISWKLLLSITYPFSKAIRR